MRKHYPNHLRGQSGWLSRQNNIYEPIIEEGRKMFKAGQSRPNSNTQKQKGWDEAFNLAKDI